MLRKLYVVLKLAILNGKSMVKKYIIFIISVATRKKQSKKKIKRK